MKIVHKINSPFYMHLNLTYPLISFCDFDDDDGCDDIDDEEDADSGDHEINR